jgi:hypothetical protein
MLMEAILIRNSAYQQNQALPPVATRYEKTMRNFLSMVMLAAAMIWLRDLA